MLFTALLLTIIAIAAAFVCGLTFDLEPRLGWLVVLTANVSLVIQNLPYIFYRDPGRKM